MYKSGPTLAGTFLVVSLCIENVLEKYEDLSTGEERANNLKVNNIRKNNYLIKKTIRPFSKSSRSGI